MWISDPVGLQSPCYHSCYLPVAFSFSHFVYRFLFSCHKKASYDLNFIIEDLLLIPIYRKTFIDSFFQPLLFIKNRQISGQNSCTPIVEHSSTFPSNGINYVVIIVTSSLFAVTDSFLLPKFFWKVNCFFFFLCCKRWRTHHSCQKLRRLYCHFSHQVKFLYQLSTHQKRYSPYLYWVKHPLSGLVKQWRLPHLL